VKQEQKPHERSIISELEIAEQRAQDEALQAYLDQMAQLQLDKDRLLRQSKEGEDARTLARARTLTVFTRLDGGRKGSILQFLYETGLITGEQPLLSLSNADLRETSLHAAEMSEINLDRTNLNQADFTVVNFHGAFLREVNLHRANLSGVDLSNANLRNSDLSKVNLGFFEADKGTWYLRQLSQIIEPSPREDIPQTEGSAQIEIHQTVGTVYRGRRIDSGINDGLISTSVVVGSVRSQANLRNADLTNVDFREANLLDAEGVTNARLHQQAFSLKGATMPDGQKYEDWLKSKDRKEDG
jgi:uncharacterized protein YjbI with pentapeptide repeats